MFVQGDLAEREPAMAQLAAAAVSGLPRAGPELRRRLEPVLLRGLGDARIRGPLSSPRAPGAPARAPPFWKSRVLRRRPHAPSPQAQMFDA